MTVTVKQLIPAKQAENVQTTQYTATFPTGSVGRTTIDKFTVTNTSGTAAALSVNIVASGDTAVAGNLILSAKVIQPGETYTCPELVGQVIAQNGFISTLASAATSLTIAAGGREITT